MLRAEEFEQYIRDEEIARMSELGFDAMIPSKTVKAISKQAHVAANWEYQHKEARGWEEDTDGDKYHGKSMFLKFIRLDPGEYNGRTVLAACVGRGKEVSHILNFGASVVLVNEIGDGIYDIPRLFSSHMNQLVVCRSDVRYLPFKADVAALAICDHALQHVEGYEKGYAALLETLRPDGKIAICVYSHENNFLMTHLIEPLKGLLHLLPLKILRFLSLLPAVLIYIYMKLVMGSRALISNKAVSRLPLHDHMVFWAPNGFQFIWLACFDLLHAPISHHFSKSEMERLATRESQSITVLEHTHGTTWSMVAVKD